MDMLGYKEMWCHAEREGSQDTFLQRLYEALKEGQDWLLPNDNDVWPTEKDRSALKAFTDNIVIGWPVRGDGESELGSIFSNIAFFQLRMATNGFFLRGAFRLVTHTLTMLWFLEVLFLKLIREKLKRGTQGLS
jgi:hypothetical protein